MYSSCISFLFMYYTIIYYTRCVCYIRVCDSDDLIYVESSGRDGRQFTLDDVFNDTFDPKLYSAVWTSGLLCVCLCVCMRVCVGGEPLPLPPKHTHACTVLHTHCVCRAVQACVCTLFILR